MKIQFALPPGFADRTFVCPLSWPVPRVGEAVTLLDNDGPTRFRIGPTWLVVDVLWSYQPADAEPTVIIKLHPEG